MSTPIRVLVADDHLIVRQGLQLILETTSDIQMVGEAADGLEALQQAAALQPDVILMDLRMPGMDGITAIEHLQAEQPQAAVVILTTFNEDELMLRGLRAGARGFLLKDTDRESLFNAIRAAARGETLLRPEILARLVALSHPPESSAAASPSPAETLLSPREQEVLTGVAAGERNKEIAFRLGITERTVKAHLDSVYHKLGVDSRAAAVSAALQRGLLPKD
jgi:NarL family two-component system response regulator YdfI